ncbi:hypothetical protein GETHOR_08200 [Geothrix oryzae]|uniref:DUF262 domain-containing protein n=1 Tax=Geothrix oryzae TaxID=2927975 RepID=A0ABN6UX70_9BACT|nr:DUF262 domain-containing HNH endonuclease family protein [Geothrix oryzae]BDU68719.1 hypothetical protein GETHOR_08200 [Geothrix oryzae]
MDLQTNKSNLEAIFNGINKRISVPKYQRSYSWTLDQIDELWNDIFRSYENNVEYFLGPIVFIHKNNPKSESESGKWDIIDGQQRLATLTILIKSINALFNKYQKTPGDPIFAQIFKTADNENCAMRGFSSTRRTLYPSEGIEEFYFKPSDRDINDFNKYIYHSEEFYTDFKINTGDRRFLKAKKRFCECIYNNFLRDPDGIKKLFEFELFIITKLLFIEIVVADDQDAYLLFEGLNSKGLDLRLTDLVKNYILSKAGSSFEKIYQSWESMVENIAKTRFNEVDFISFYWTAHTGPISTRELYKAIKQTHDNETKVAKFSTDLKNTSDYFSTYANIANKYPALTLKSELDKALAEMNTLGYRLPYPLIILAKSKGKDTLLPIFARKLNNFLFRFITIGGYRVGEAEQIFTQVRKALVENDSDENILALINHADVSDINFRSRFRDNQFDSNSIAKYVLSKIEDHKSGKGKIIVPENVNLEHVAPINHSKWSITGSDEEIENAIYSIGNMTILEEELNKSIKNDVFAKKVPCYAPKKEAEEKGSGISITNEIYQAHVSGGVVLDWTIESIKLRAEKFATYAVDIWKI